MEAEEYIHRSEYLESIFNAMASIDGLDPITKTDKEMVNTIRSKCLEMVSLLVNEMHSELFDQDEE